jgi:formate dehydrogenase accessory protein FdhE
MVDHQLAALGSAGVVVRALAHELSRQSRDAGARWPDGVPNVAAAEARLVEGVPALAGELLLDGEALVHAVRGLAAAVEAVDGDVGRTVLLIVERLEQLEARSLDALAVATVAGAWDAVVSFAASLGLDEYALIAAVEYGSRPALVAAAAKVRSLLTSFDRVSPECPVCGSPPLLAELSGKDGARSLRCGRCGSRWRYPRLACVWCGEREARELRALHGEGEAGVRQADCCRTCRGYLKAVSVLDPLEYVALLEVDLATAGLDLVAVERGYTRGSEIARRSGAA